LLSIKKKKIVFCCEKNIGNIFQYLLSRDVTIYLEKSRKEYSCHTSREVDTLRKIMTVESVTRYARSYSNISRGIRRKSPLRDFMSVIALSKATRHQFKICYNKGFYEKKLIN